MDTNAERAIVSAVLHNSLIYNQISNLLDAEYFDNVFYKLCWRAFQNISAYGGTITEIVVSEAIRQIDGWNSVSIGCLSDLMQAPKCYEETAILSYVKIITDGYKIRQANKMCKEIETVNNSGKSSPERIFQIIDKYQDLKRIAVDKRPKSLPEAIKESIDNDTEEILLEKNGQQKLITGYIELDKLVRMRNNDICIIAARPSMGKTTMALNIMYNMAFKKKKKVVFVSIEMSEEEIIEKLLCKHYKIDSYSIKDMNKLEIIEMKKRFYQLIEREGIRFEIDCVNYTIFDIISYARTSNAIEHIDCLFIDYLQLVTAGGGKRFDSKNIEVDYICKQAKVQLAKELKTVVFLLSQLNRNIENRENPYPKLSDLRESGAIEQDASVVAFLHRDSFYNKKENGANLFNSGQKNTKPDNITTVIIEKNRFGKTGSVDLIFNRDTGDFKNYEDA